LAVIDALAIDDMTPFWRLVAASDHETIVHAGREEHLFCHRAIGQRPHRLLDVQIAAGMVGLEYPAAYSTLVSKLLGQALGKGETRTNWRRRPLSQRQLDYAVQDVAYLGPLSDVLKSKLAELGRTRWLEVELDAWQDGMEAAETSQRWRLVPGVAALPPRSLAIVRALWHWRDSEAKRRNRPPRRVLRDDLLVELARRQTADIKRIRAVRGLDWSRMRSNKPWPFLKASGPAPRAAARALS
jgi:ribonuclease D